MSPEAIAKVNEASHALSGTIKTPTWQERYHKLLESYERTIEDQRAKDIQLSDLFSGMRRKQRELEATVRVLEMRIAELQAGLR
jgi:hypothetical protein